MPVALKKPAQVVQESAVDAADLGHVERFTVKTGMKFWVDVDFSNPSAARALLTAGETFDTSDVATHAILKLAPEFEDTGEVTP